MARIFITGSTDGLGRAAAENLMGEGHQVVLHARSTARAADLGDLDHPHAGVVIGDLASGQDVRSIADQVNALGRMDAVIHNAGIYSTPDRGDTPEGHATILAVNTLAPYMLTALITRPARLVYLSSGLHRGGEGSLDDVDWQSRIWDAGRAYAETKLQVAALAAALAARWPDVRSNAVDPGWVRTRMGGANAPVGLDNGQQTQSWLAVSDDPATQVSGRYWHAMREAEAVDEVTDAAFQNRLLATLEALTGVALP
jgi:NAD(P)-dependent dehydrogenase (short-subunit alcohol dehydrogenase family)